MVEDYKKTMTELLDKREDPSYTEEDEFMYLEILDSIWWQLSEQEQEQIEGWLREELERRK